MVNFCGRSDHDGGVLQLISIPYRLVTHTAALKTTVHRSAPLGWIIYWAFPWPLLKCCFRAL
jgi:hypothetical protein